MTAESVCEPAQSMFANDVASSALGIEVVDLQPGRAITRMTVRADMANGHKITHGGYVFLLADTTFALACNGYGEAAVAARADIRFLRPTRVGDTLTAEAVEVARFGRSGIYDVTVRSGAEAVAEFRGDSRQIPART